MYGKTLAPRNLRSCDPPNRLATRLATASTCFAETPDRAWAHNAERGRPSRSFWGVPQGGVIIENSWEMRDAKTRETKNCQRADDAVGGVPNRGADRVGCDRGRHRRRAFELYCNRGHKDGHDVDDWLNAERDLRDASSSSAA